MSYELQKVISFLQVFLKVKLGYWAVTYSAISYWDWDPLDSAWSNKGSASSFRLILFPLLENLQIFSYFLFSWLYFFCYLFHY